MLENGWDSSIGPSWNVTPSSEGISFTTGISFPMEIILSLSGLSAGPESDGSATSLPIIGNPAVLTASPTVTDSGITAETRPSPFALILGAGYGVLLNKVKGGEMMIATYVGFSSVAFMCIMWLLLPYKSSDRVWGSAGTGLRTTISVEKAYLGVLDNFLRIEIGHLAIPTGTILFFAFLSLLIWLFLRTKTGTAMTAVGSNPIFATASGVSVDRMRILSVVLSTWLGAVGIIVYEQSFGFIQLYMGPFNMALPAVSAVLLGGASVNKASIANVVIGTLLFQGILTMTPSVMNGLIQMDVSEVIRIIVSNGMILYALTRKQEVTR